MEPTKDKIKIIHNFISQEEIDHALNLLDTKVKERWDKNPRYLVVPNSIIAASVVTTTQAYKISEQIKKEFNIPQKEIFCVTNDLGTWTYEGASGLHEDVYNSRYVKFSSIVYLTSDYEGGEIEFPDFDFTYKPVAGDLILFPSHGYLHEVKPVISGNRSTVVGFFSDVHPMFWHPKYVPSKHELY